MKTLDVLGIGHALLDSIVKVDDALLYTLGFKKAEMFLVDELQYTGVLEQIDHGSAVVAPGGSCANTVETLATLGLRVGFVGTVGKDAQGEVFEKEMMQMGVDMKLARSDTPTGHTVTLVTPDGERTFATYLGAAVELTKEDIDESQIRKAEMLHLEGYIFDSETMREAVHFAADVAKRKNVKVSMDISDVGVVERHKKELLDFVTEYVDVFFANEEETKALTGKDGEEALRKIARMSDIAVVTKGEKGSSIQHGSTVHHIDPVKTQVVNTLGAGDAYAAGMLHGIVHNRPLKDAGEFASRLAASAVASITARPSEDILK